MERNQALDALRAVNGSEFNTISFSCEHPTYGWGISNEPTKPDAPTHLRLKFDPIRGPRLDVAGLRTALETLGATDIDDYAERGYHYVVAKVDVPQLKEALLAANVRFSGDGLPAAVTRSA